MSTFFKPPNNGRRDRHVPCDRNAKMLFSQVGLISRNRKLVKCDPNADRIAGMLSGGICTIVPQKIVDMSGRKFTYLQVVKYSHEENGMHFWLVRCYCGEYAIVKSFKGKCRACTYDDEIRAMATTM